MSEAESTTPPVAVDDRLVRLLDRIAPTAWRAMLVLALLHIAAAILVFDPMPQAGGDNAAYRALGDALATGRGYVRLWEPTQPAETLYPPVFPIIVAVAMRFGIQSWAALQAMMIGFSTALVCVSFAFLRRLMPSSHAFLCYLVIALSPGLLASSHALLSDVPFAALTGLALWAFASLDTEDPLDANRERLLLAMGFAATLLAYFTRSAGLPLVVAAVAWLLWRRKRVAAGTLAVIAVSLAFAWAAHARSAGGANYTDFLRYIDPYQPELGRVDGVDVLTRIGDNFDRYASRHLPTLLYGDIGAFAAFGGWVFVILAAIGYWFRLRRPSVSELWVPMYLGLLLLWPATWSGDRLLLPMYPVLLAYAVRALPFAREFIPRPVVLGALLLASITLIASDVQQSRRGAKCRFAYRHGVMWSCVEDGWGDFTMLSTSMRGKFPDETVVLSRKPTILYSESGYRSLMYPLSTKPDTFFAEARRAGAEYVVADASNLANLYLFAALRAHPNRFCAVPNFQRTSASLMRIVPDGVMPRLATDTTIDIKNCPPNLMP